ncbi:MAG TPA: phosphotransferase, partial [Xanthobacteraceae bacterium]
NIFWRAVLMTLAPSRAASLLPWCRAGMIEVSDAWLGELRSALATLRHAQTMRAIFSPDQIRQMIAGHIGPNAPAATEEWHVAHGDLHWANLTAPRCMLLDWEHWGLFPRGYDLGRLLGCSAFAPALMARIVDAFYDEFRSPAARVGLLAGIASVKGHIALGELDPAAGWALEPLIQRLLWMEREGRRPRRAR